MTELELLPSPLWLQGLALALPALGGYLAAWWQSRASREQFLHTATQSIIAVLNARMEQLQQTLDASDSAHRAAQGQIAKLREENAFLRGEVQELKRMNTRLAAQLKGLCERLPLLMQDADFMEHLIRELQAMKARVQPTSGPQPDYHAVVPLESAAK